MRTIMASLLVLLAAPRLASAQDAGVVDCDPPLTREPLTVNPPVGARGVALNAPLRVLYSLGYFEGGMGGDPATLISVQRCADGCSLITCMDPGTFVPGRVQVIGDELVFLPDEPWDPSQAYSGVALGLDDSLPFSFCTGTDTDSIEPTVGRLTSVTSTAGAQVCGSSETGYRIAATVAPATEIGGAGGSVEYLLFQTRGAGLEAPILRNRAPNIAATDTITTAFVLPAEEATAPICVRIAAVDGVGNVGWSEPHPEDCVNPVQGNYFYPICSASVPSRGSMLGLLLFGCAAFLLVLRPR